MTMAFYAVKDLMTGKFMNPILMESDEVATRQLKSNINNIPLWKDNPQDFDLFRVGSFDDETGEIMPDMEKIANGRSVYVPVQRND